MPGNNRVAIQARVSQVLLDLPDPGAVPCHRLLALVPRRVLTGNAGHNEHMVAINEQLGYEISSVIRMWELAVSPA